MLLGLLALAFTWCSTCWGTQAQLAFVRRWSLSVRITHRQCRRRHGRPCKYRLGDLVVQGRYRALVPLRM